MELARGKSQYAQFYMGTTKDDEASTAQGRPIFKDTPYIKIFVAGDKDNIIDQPVWDDPLHQNSHTTRFPEEWKRFKEGHLDDAQLGGTPLALLPGVSKAQVQEMAYFNVRTVEQLADMSDANVSRFPGVRKMRDEAKGYIERAAGAAPEKRLREELEKRDNEIDLLKKQMAELISASKKGK
jgi:hypothetical protein